MDETSSPKFVPVPGYPHLKRMVLTPEQLAKGQAAFKAGRELRHAVARAFKSRASYLRSCACYETKPKRWIQAEWDKLYRAYFRKLEREAKANG